MRQDPFPTGRGLTRRTALLAFAAAGAATVAGCAPAPSATPLGGDPAPQGASAPQPSPTPLTGAEMAARATVPVLCYHQVRPWASGDSGYAKDSLICPPEYFREQLDAIKGAGWTTVTPDAYLAHVRGEATLPDKAVLLTFDDGKDNQPQTAFAELTARGMTGVFYVMTVVLNKKGWVSATQLREVADAGHVIGSHTYDHQRTPDLTTPEQWAAQYVKSRAKLQELSGQAVESLAYPYGLWAPPVIAPVTEAGYTTAFQLTDKPVSPDAPAHTLRRQLAVSRWSGERVVAELAAFAERTRASATKA